MELATIFLNYIYCSQNHQTVRSWPLKKIAYTETLKPSYLNRRFKGGIKKRMKAKNFHFYRLSEVLGLTITKAKTWNQIVIVQGDLGGSGNLKSSPKALQLR